MQNDHSIDTPSVASEQFGFGTQIRKSPYFDATVRWGAKQFSVYNHMYIPRDFGSPEDNFWSLVNTAILCDVAVERQVEISGPDAARFVQMLTGRNLSGMQVGQVKYVLITNETGGILNDPVLLKLAEDHFWLSLSDSDILLWASGIAVFAQMDVQILEPDVSPLQLQGPESGKIMEALFGSDISNLKYYWFREYELDGIPLIISRTGWSSELGYELFLRDSTYGDTLWEKIMVAGRPFGLKPGHTSTIRRIEGGMLSYHADADFETNPFEVNLGRLVDLEMETDFIGKSALKRIQASGVQRLQVGLEIYGSPLTQPNTTFWPVYSEREPIGKVTSAVYSPRLEKNIALALVETAQATVGTRVTVETSQGELAAEIVPVPFYDSRKSLASGAATVQKETPHG